MKAYVLEDVNRLEYKEVATPELKSGEVLVEMKAAGICGSDIPRIFETGTYHFPTIPGHEFSGKVVQTGDGVDANWYGKRVGIFPLIPCKECPACKKSGYEMCSHYNYLGSRCDGGFAEYVAVPEWNLIELPDAVSYEEAALLEPASVALHAVRRVNWGEQIASVALFGLGTIGILIAEWLHINGAKNVYATGHSEEHGKLMQEVTSLTYQYQNAKQTDVKAWVSRETDEKGVDVVFDCVGSSQSLEDAIMCVRPGGQVVIVANPKGDVELSKDIYWKILRKQIRFTGTWNSSFVHEDTDDWNMVLKHCAKGELKLREMVTHELPFDELQKGLAVMREKSEYRNKVMVVREN